MSCFSLQAFQVELFGDDLRLTVTKEFCPKSTHDIDFTKSHIKILHIKGILLIVRSNIDLSYLQISSF